MFLRLVCPILLVQFWFCSWLASPHKHQMLRWQWILLLEKVVKACFSALLSSSVYMCFLTQKRLSGRSARPSVRHTILAPIFDAGLTGAWHLRQLGKASRLNSRNIASGTEWYRLIPWILKDTGEDQVLCESLWYFASGLNLVLCAGNLASSSRSGPQCISEHSGNCFAIWSQDISSIGSRRSLGNFE